MQHLVIQSQALVQQVFLYLYCKIKDIHIFNADSQLPVKVGIPLGIFGGILLVIACGLIFTVIRKKYRKGDYTCTCNIMSVCICIPHGHAGYKSLKDDVDGTQSSRAPAQEEDTQTLMETVQ